MAKVAVVTDSVASIPEALIEELHIYWAAYYIHKGKEVLRDLVTVQRDSFYAWLGTAVSIPKTAAPSPADYLQIYEKMAASGVRDIVSIHITSKASAAYQSAQLAQAMMLERVPDMKIAVIDTLNVAMCQGWMVIEAARAAQAGRSLGDIVQLVHDMIPITRMIQTADTLRYLHLGGRIGKAQHLVGSLLSIKPLIGMEDGVIVPLGKARGRKKAYQMMVDRVETAVGPNGKVKIAYLHAAALEEVDMLRTLVEKRLTCIESIVAELSPALGVHTGPGTTGLCYVPVIQ